MKRASGLVLFLLFVISQTGYSGTSPARTAPKSPNVDAVQLLREDLDHMLADTRFARAQIGIEVFSLDRTEVLYGKNALQLLIPASNNKIITASVALMRLGADYRFKTHVLTDGQVENGVLRGNLIISGSGDPTYSSKFNGGDPFAAFRTWAANLKERNIQTIEGSILGDVGTFGESALGQGWEWNDLPSAFAAPVSALQFNDNMMALTIVPGTKPGDPALVHASPLEGYLQINNRAVTGPEASPPDIRIQNSGSDETVEILGTIPAKGAVVQETVAVRHPVLYFLSALQHILSGEGIAAGGLGLAKRSDATGRLSQLWIHSSPELSEIVKQLLKNSINLYAETLVRALGLALRGEATFAKGREVVEEALNQIGIETETYSYADGSGLSRLNLESADSFVRLLTFMYQDKNFQTFYDALPIAGVDGTLSTRMKRSQAENNVHAKTGSMANVSSISGYVKTLDGEMLAFSIVMNGYLGPRDAVESMQDRVLARLADFSRQLRDQKARSPKQ
jgi:D-alanyl-D-alanine carboxypeptidase/D-alanyl-D-alanine-endopeptidase (penicillin-binding protein 4)